MARVNWTKDELIVAFNLYCKTSFGRIHNRNPEIISLAKALGRTPSALAWKLANFARLDPSLQDRNIAGAGHGAKLEEEVWLEFSHDWERLAFESERLRMLTLGAPSFENAKPEAFPEGRMRDSAIRVRVNQGFFRSAILAAYDSTCCITGISVTGLLCASHIVPWSVDVCNRTNPRNGLCLNALHDRAFDSGLITVTTDYRVMLSPYLNSLHDRGLDALLRPYDNASITVPKHFRPDGRFLDYHMKNIYRAA